MLEFLRNLVMTWLLARFGVRGCLGCGCLTLLVVSLLVYLLLDAAF